MIREEFNAIGEKPGKAVTEAIDAIIEARPDLAGKVFSIASNGSTALTLAVGDEIFKTGKYDIWEDSIEKEGIVLDMLAGKKLPLAIPKVTIVGAEYQFLGISRLPGVTLSTVFNDFSKKERRAAARAIAHFKVSLERQLDAKKMVETLDEKMPDCEFRSWRAGFGYSFYNYASLALDMPEVRALTEQYGVYHELKSYLNRIEGRKAVTSHGDLHEFNVLVDPDTKQVTGVIDFGSVHMTIMPEGEFFRMNAHPDRSGHTTRQVYDRAFVALLEKYYTGQSRVVSKRDRLCFGLMEMIESKTGRSVAYWTDPKDEDYMPVISKMIEFKNELKELDGKTVRKTTKTPQNGH